MGRRGCGHSFGEWASVTAPGDWRSCILVASILFGKQESETLSENMGEYSLKSGESRDW